MNGVSENIGCTVYKNRAVGNAIKLTLNVLKRNGPNENVKRGKRTNANEGIYDILCFNNIPRKFTYNR